MELNRFMTRVELHDKSNDEEAYTTLHELMRAAGFSRTILGNDNVTYQMPPAEYWKETASENLDTVFSKAQTAANKVTLKNAVFVSEVKWAKWDGLTPAKSH